MSDIQLFSKKMSILFQLFFIVTPIFAIVFWLNPEQMLSFGINPFPIPQAKVTFNTLSKILGFSISLIPTTVVMILFYRLSTLFKNYQMGKVFSQENVFCYKKLGKFLFLLACVNFLCTGLMSVALSFQNPAGERFLSLSFGMPQIFPIIIGLVIIGISYVMEEAFRLAEDLRYTI
jgi:hypothetical protein